MAPARSTKRVSDYSAPSTKHLEKMDGDRVLLKAGSPSTPSQRSPIRKRKVGLSMHQKQALIENLRLETTERARRLRAQYSVQAQSLRSRIEIRINRIPTSLRKMKMQDLLLRCMEQGQQQTTTPRLPPVPVSAVASTSPFKFKHVHKDDGARPAGRVQKRFSSEFARDKENENEHGEHPKKKARAGQTTDGAPVRPAQVLSPTSSNSRMANRHRPASPTKSQIARPGSPLKSTAAGFSTATATSVLSNMVEKAKAKRGAGTRKVTAASSASSSAGGATTAAQTRRGAAPGGARAPPPRPATRAGRRINGNSETSETSTSTVVRKTGGRKATASAAAARAKKTVKATVRNAIGGGPKKPVAKAATSVPATSSTGRILRKRA